MDLTKAQRLLIKIQAFLDHGNGNELSRLEKDLMKSYIQQLYDAVTSEEVHTVSEKPKFTEAPVSVPILKEEPPVKIFETPKPEPPKPVIPEFVVPEPVISVPQEIPVEVKIPVPEPVVITYKPEPKPIQIPITEPVRETVQSPKVVSAPMDTMEALNKLFEPSTAEEMAGRFNQIPISSIESAMGLNERIFTLNELFGGDKGLFEATCAALNNLNTFHEAKSMLIHGPATQFRWADPERVKMAEQFIRIVARRYPKA
jgi:hypothetical protein